MPSTTARTTRAKSSAAATADEAQQPPKAAPAVEGEPVDEKAEQRRANTTEMIDNLRTIIVERMRGEMNPKFEKLQSQLDDLAATLTAVQEPQSDDAGVMLEEDALADKISYAVEVWLKGMYGEEGTATGATLNERLDGLATALAQHQSDVNQRLQQNREVLDAKLREAALDQLAPVGTGGAPAIRVPGVYAKVHQLMLRVEEIGKNRDFRAEGRNDGSPRIEYSFRGIDDAMDAVGAALRQVGLIMRSEVVNAEHEVHAVEKKPGWVQHWATTRLHMRYVFVDPADGSEHPVEGYGVGKDLGDKDGSKASSAAMKYALFQGLCIPVKGMNIDPETDNPTDPGPGPEQRQEPLVDRAAVQRQADQERPAEQPPAPRPDEPAGVRAAKALQAAKAARTQEELTRVLVQATQEELLLEPVEGKPLQIHLVTIRRTLRPAADTGGQDG